MRIENEDGGEKVNTPTPTKHRCCFVCADCHRAKILPLLMNGWMEDGGGKCHKHLALRELEMYSWE
jgi:hypothetical protein